MVNRSNLVVGLKKSAFNVVTVTTFSVVALITLVMGAIFLVEMVNGQSILSSTGRAAVIVSLSLVGVVGAQLAIKKFSVTDVSTSASFSRTQLVLFGLVNLSALTFAVWHGISAAYRFVPPMAIANMSFFEIAYTGTIRGFFSQPETFISGWLLVVGIAGLLSTGALLLIRRKLTFAKGFSLYTILLSTGVLAHLTLI